MIQRIQTIYLLVAVVLFVLLLFIPVGSFQNGFVLTAFSIKGLASGARITLSIWPVLVFGLIVEVLTIFMYKNRKMQMRFVIFNSILQVAQYIAIFATIFSLKGITSSNFSIGLGLFIPLIVIILNILAYKAIHKDEALVRSLDRLR